MVLLFLFFFFADSLIVFVPFSELSTVEEDAVIKKMEDDALSRKGPAKPVSLTDSARIQMLRLSKSQKLFSFKGKVQMVHTITSHLNDII